jgi:hypothetical protein
VRVCRIFLFVSVIAPFSEGHEKPAIQQGHHKMRMGKCFFGLCRLALGILWRHPSASNFA